MLYDKKNEPFKTLYPKDLDDQTLDIPVFTEDEIWEKSKRDLLSKTITVIQTTWFIIQYLARVKERLPNTELETVTLAFAVLNIGTFALWWNKPHRVRFPIRVYKKSSPNINQEGINPPRPSAGEIEESLPVIDNDPRTSPRPPTSEYKENTTLPGDKSKTKISLFFADDNEADAQVFAAFFAISSVFGALHFFSWSYDFPTHKDQTIWRTLILVTVSVPVFFVVLGAVYALCCMCCDAYQNRIRHIVLKIYSFSVWFFIACRCVLLIESFITLHLLPAGAYQIVEWTDFIPHI